MAWFFFLFALIARRNPMTMTVALLLLEMEATSRERVYIDKETRCHGMRIRWLARHWI